MLPWGWGGGGSGPEGPRGTVVSISMCLDPVEPSFVSTTK